MNSKSEPQYTCDFEKFCNNEVTGKEDEEETEEKAAKDEILRLRSRLNELEKADEDNRAKNELLEDQLTTMRAGKEKDDAPTEMAAHQQTPGSPELSKSSALSQSIPNFMKGLLAGR